MHGQKNGTKKGMFKIYQILKFLSKKKQKAVILEKSHLTDKLIYFIMRMLLQSTE